LPWAADRFVPTWTNSKILDLRRERIRVAYIIDVMRETIEPHPDRNHARTLCLDLSYIAPIPFTSSQGQRHSLFYHVLFQLSWFETGKGEIIVPWARVGAFIRSEQGNIIDNSTTVKRRLADLFENKCIAVNRAARRS